MQRVEVGHVAGVEALVLGLDAQLVHLGEELDDRVERVLEHRLEHEVLAPRRVLRVVHRAHVQRGHVGAKLAQVGDALLDRHADGARRVVHDHVVHLGADRIGDRAEVLDLVARHAVGRAGVDVDHRPALVHDPPRLGRVLLGRVGDGRALVAVGDRAGDRAGDHHGVLEAAHDAALRSNCRRRRPAAESSISWASRLNLVSSRLALTTQWVAVRRYHGAWASKNSAAASCSRSRSAYSAGSSAASRALERVHAGLGLLARLECLAPGRGHQALCLQPGHLLDVHPAPVASLLPRGEALSVALRVDPVHHAVDPAEAQRLVHGLRPAHHLPAGGLLVEADPDLGLGVVVGGEPFAEAVRVEVQGLLAQTGITPCFFHGRSTRLLSAISSALITVGRVSRGSITSSIIALPAAM